MVLSDVWSDEARDFTPWLADNMDLLSQEIGLPLAWEGTEVPVDGFSADILATTTDGSHVVIENQYGRTDHDHLGKLLTYTAGLEAQIVIWVAERFHDAHLSAIRWLNETHSGAVFVFGGAHSGSANRRFPDGSEIHATGGA